MSKSKPASKKPAGPKVDLYAKVTDQIVAALEQGVRPWMKPWSAPAGAAYGSLPKRVNGKAYTGVNVVLLWIVAAERGYVNPTWMTYNQAAALGGQVRKGENEANGRGSTEIVYASKFKKKVEDEKTGKEKEIMIPFLKSYRVFNVEQIDGLPDRFYLSAPEPVTEEDAAKAKLERIDHADAYFLATGGDVRHGGHRAYFSPLGDFIQMPEFDSFRDAESYYATLGHEFVHWTGSDKRLNREFGKRFGDQAYAAEELVAELGAAFLCASLGLTPEIREDHAAYVASWLKVLKGDKKFIFTASSLATKAAEHLDSYSVETEEEIEEAGAGESADAILEAAA